MQISQLFLTDPLYPDILRDGERPLGPLYCLGTLPDGPYLAIVGTRRSTSYGPHMAYQLSGELAAAGFVIVSGLAPGIDGIAHQAAIDAGGNHTTQKLVVASNLQPSELADIMSLMEISGKLRNLGAGQWAPRVRT